MTIEVVATINSTGARTGAAEFNRALDSARGGVVSFDRASAGLTSTLKLMFAAFSVRAVTQFASGLVGAADQFTRLESRLNALGTEGKGAEAVMNSLADAAARARAPTSDLTDIYARNQDALRRLGYSQEQGIRLTETFYKLGTISGASLESQSKALQQLSQGFGAGALRGEEFNSVAEQMPGILRVVADQTGKTSGELRKMAADGKITADLIANALLNASESVDNQFGKMAETADQAATVMADSVSRNFGKIADEVGLSAAWAGAINAFTDAMGGPFAQGAMRFLAESLAGAAKGVETLIGAATDARSSFVAWYQVLGDTAPGQAFKGWVDQAIESLGRFAYWTAEAVKGVAGLFASTAAAIAPEFAKSMTDASNQVAALEARTAALSGFGSAVEENGEPRLGTYSQTAPLAVKFGAGDSGSDSAEKSLAQIQKQIEQERIRSQIIRAQMDGNVQLEASLRNQLEIASRITPEMRAQHPELARQLETHIAVGNAMQDQLSQQSKLLEQNKQFADEFASTITNGFANAIRSGQSFSETLRGIAGQLIEVITKAAVLDPLQKSLSSAISGGLGSGGFDFGSLFSGFSFARGTVLHSPAEFSAGGMSGQAGESGPEAILPLRRGPGGQLGVVSTGGQSGGTVVNITITGDATDETVAKMERVAQSVFSQRAPGVVRESVSAVRREHIADATYLRR